MHAGRAARSQAGPGIGRCGHGDCLRGDEGRIDAGAGVQGQVQGVGKGIAPNSKLGHCEIRNQLNIEERFKARRWGPLRMTARIEGMMPTRREHWAVSCITCRPVSLGQISSPARTRNAAPPHIAYENPERKTKNQNRIDHPIK